MLGRYLLKEVLFPHAVGVLLFALLLTLDLLSSLSGFLLSRGAGPREVGMLVLLRLPWTLSLALPLGLVFALLVGLAGLIRRSELKAAYAAGVPPLALLRPLLLLALGVGGLNLWLLAGPRPQSLQAYEAFLTRYLFGTVQGVVRDRVYAPPGFGVYYAQEVQVGEGANRLGGVRVVDGEGRVYSAPEGIWDQEGWRIQGYVVDGEGFRPFQGVLPFPALFAPRETLTSKDPYDAIPLGELWAQAQVDPKARFGLYRRLSDALGTFLLAWTAAALGLALREAAWAFLGVVLLIFGYYILWTLVAQLAQYQVNPVLAFLPNLFYGLLALGLTWRLR